MEFLIDESCAPSFGNSENVRTVEKAESSQMDDDDDGGDGVPSNTSWSRPSILQNLLIKDKEEPDDGEIKSVDQDLQDQDDELRALGISVVDQLSLERDVEAAVDKAVTVHARKQRFQMIKREIQDVKRNIKQGDLKIGILSERLSGMRRRVVDPRQYFSVEKEVKDKVQQVAILKNRQDVLQKRLSAAEVNEEELDGFELEDGEILDDEDDVDNGGVESTSQISGNERERLIREGKMTPFGTVMTADSSKTVSVMRPTYTQAEKHKMLVATQKRGMKSGPTKEDMISVGEMTPFGSVMKETTSMKGKSTDSKQEKATTAMTDFEKYLQDQIGRQKQHSNDQKGIKRKKSTGNSNYGRQRRIKKPKEYIRNKDFDVDGGDASNTNTSLPSIKKTSKSEYETKVKKTKGKTTSSKDPIKMRILHPKQKKRTKEALGSITSELEVDQYKEVPRRILSERVTLEGSDSENGYPEENSGSEYQPSDDDFQEDEWEDWDNKDDNNHLREEKTTSNNQKEKVDTPKRKRKKKVKIEDDWSGDEMLKGKGRHLKEIDDGNIESYVKRIERWKEERLKQKHAKILRGEDLDSEEEEEEGYEEFDGGYKIPLGIWNKLYKYQRTCVKWLWELHSQGCGGIMGDEMGLGKTIQMITFLVGLSYSRLSNRNERWKGLGPVLIVCPATVLHQWVKEFHKWWPPFRVAVLHESGAFLGKRPALIHNINKFDGVLITSYSGVQNQVQTLLHYNWHYIILDEGHKIRNPEAQITVALKRFQTPHRLILSGSPIQNSLKELWSLFDFVFPGKLGTLPVFLAEFAVPITHGGYANASKLEVQTAFKCASVLRDTINPYLLRRMKNDVRDHLNLPDKNEQVLFCSLSEEQRRAYQGYLSGDQVKCIMGGRMKVFVGLINLRKICNHPDLFTGGPSNSDGYESRLQPELKYGWWGRAGKMHVLKSILRLWSKQGHRVLLFTQSRQMMCILEKFLLEEEHAYLKMDGTTSVSSRQPLIEKFNTEESYFVFLLTTRVGGLGINLTGADRVVIYDPDWNPSTDSQAKERAWRIGQLRHVTIYRLLTSGTIEEKIYHRQIFKQFLTNRVLKDPKQQRFFKTNDLYELFTLNEGYKEKTESSAIFAGTNSEIKVNVDENADEESDEESTETKRPYEKVQSLSLKSKEGKSYKKHSSNKVTPKRSKNSEKPVQQKSQYSSHKTENNLTHIQRMKELAKQISKNIGKKSTSLESESNVPKADIPDIQEDKIHTVSTSGQDLPELKSDVTTTLNLETIPERSIDCNEEEKYSINDGSTDAKCLTKSVDFSKEEICIKNDDSADEINFIKPIGCVTEEACSENEDTNGENSVMQTTGDIKEEVCSDNETSPCENSHIKPIDIGTEEICSDSDYSLDNNCLTESPSVSLDSLKMETENESRRDTDREQCKVFTDKTEVSSLNSSEKHRKKNKKKDKHREKKEKYRDKEKRERAHKKGRKIDGERIDFLVKKRSYRKTEEEEEAAKESAKSQDEYVLTKLFQKSGVHTALSHDNILSNSDPDYLLMEGEAERVAKQALKAVRASRARCRKPWSSSKETPESKKSRPKFGNKKNTIFTDSVDREIKKDKENKNIEKKKRMFNGGMDDDDEESDNASEMKFIPKKKPGFGESSGGMSSAQLLSRISQRNKTVGSLELTEDVDDDDGYDPDYPSTAAAAASYEEEVDPEIQDNIDLLSDIRNFVAFQAEVDGSASTQEIVSRFRDRLPPGQSPFFKALLTQICDFHRKTSGEGIWSLKGEFR